MFHESLLILLRSSSPAIMYDLHLHSNWEIVNEHLGKCADECDISARKLHQKPHVPISRISSNMYP